MTTAPALRGVTNPDSNSTVECLGCSLAIFVITGNPTLGAKKPVPMGWKPARYGLET